MTRRLALPAVALLAVLAGAALAPGAAAVPAVQTAENASITYDDQTATDAVTVESATLPDGGFVVVYNETGGLVGHTTHLEAGTHENLTVDVSPAFERASVSVAEVHRDDGSDGSFVAGTDTAYTRRGAAVADTSYVTTDERTRSAAITTADTAAAGTPATGTTGTATPGFGVPLAVVAVAAAALLARRRS